MVDEGLNKLRVAGAHLLVERCLDQARADGVDPHSVFAEFRRKRMLARADEVIE